MFKDDKAFVAILIISENDLEHRNASSLFTTQKVAILIISENDLEDGGGNARFAHHGRNPNYIGE